MIINSLFTFALDVFQIGRDHHQPHFLHYQELFDLSETDDVSSPRLGLDGILVVLPVLEPDDVLQEGLTNVVQLFREVVITVAGKSDGEGEMWRSI